MLDAVVLVKISVTKIRVDVGLKGAFIGNIFLSQLYMSFITALQATAPIQ